MNAPRRIDAAQCDEVRPICGQCRIKHRPCSYEYARTSRFPARQVHETGTGDANLAFSHLVQNPDPGKSRRIATANSLKLSVRSVKEAKGGQGVFHTFNTVSKSTRRLGARDTSREESGLQRAVSISRPLLSRDVYLRVELSEALGESGLKWSTTFLWGSWLSAVPARLGTNAALDDAAECIVAGQTVMRSGLECDKMEADRKYTKALVSLQAALYAEDAVRYSTETLAAINILVLFDVSDASLDPYCCTIELGRTRGEIIGVAMQFPSLHTND